jgi:hypothetical protein
MAGRRVARMRMARMRMASGDGAPAPQGGTRWRASLLRLDRRAAAPVLGAGVTAAVLASAMMAAGPAAASAASPAARTATTARAATAALAGRTPATRAAARLGSPAARWLLSRAQATAGGARAMTPQSRMAAATNAFGINGAVLYGVSCTGRSQCTATGMASTRSGKNVKTVAERWNGTAWTLQSTPTPTSRALQGGTLIAGVSCTSATACMAAGFSYGTKADQLLGEGWNGRTWATQRDAAPAVRGEPSGISCTWAKDCTAVGGRDSGMTLAEHWNGRTWSAETTKHAGSLMGVSCPAAGNCTAVGTSENAKALAAHWNGKAWSDQSVASPDGINLLNDVSCTTLHCVAVGMGGTPTSSALDLTPLAEQWVGGKWSALTIPDPAPAGDFVELTSVSCTSASNCVAVGDYTDAAGTSATTLAMHWNGTTWTAESTASPAKFSALLSVSCPSATHCVAVGASSAKANGAVSPLTETWNGSTWTAVTAPR